MSAKHSEEKKAAKAKYKNSLASNQTVERNLDNIDATIKDKGEEKEPGMMGAFDYTSVAGAAANL